MVARTRYCPRQLESYMGAEQGTVAMQEERQSGLEFVARGGILALVDGDPRRSQPRHCPDLITAALLFQSQQTARRAGCGADIVAAQLEVDEQRQGWAEAHAVVAEPTGIRPQHCRGAGIFGRSNVERCQGLPGLELVFVSPQQLGRFGVTTLVHPKLGQPGPGRGDVIASGCVRFQGNLEPSFGTRESAAHCLHGAKRKVTMRRQHAHFSQ
jgi:hypothetical protein